MVRGPAWSCSCCNFQRRVVVAVQRRSGEPVPSGSPPALVAATGGRSGWRRRPAARDQGYVAPIGVSLAAISPIALPHGVVVGADKAWLFAPGASASQVDGAGCRRRPPCITFGPRDIGDRDPSPSNALGDQVPGRSRLARRLSALAPRADLDAFDVELLAASMQPARDSGPMGLFHGLRHQGEAAACRRGRAAGHCRQAPSPTSAAKIIFLISSPPRLMLGCPT